MKVQPQALKLLTLRGLAPGTVVCASRRAITGIVATDLNQELCIFVTNGAQPFTVWRANDDGARFLAVASADAVRLSFDELERSNADSETPGNLVVGAGGAAITGWHVDGMGFREPLFLQLSDWSLTDRRDITRDSITFDRWSFERLGDADTIEVFARAPAQLQPGVPG